MGKIMLGLLALFFGIYAMILELKGIANADQILVAILFGMLVFFLC
ncbi:MAG: hypothetical protein LBL20_05960 [Treponema sp.]|jgi:hypothetical protein|nr:hypothetical protein [Treponema sp.]